jgi:hypothetical protein
LQHLAVPEAKYPDSVRRQIPVAIVQRVVGVLSSVDFDCKRLIFAEEVENESVAADVERVLAPEFCLVDLPVAQQRPEESLRVGSGLA